MKRKIYDKLVEWKLSRQGRTALLIEGARRVGKSYIVEEFAKNNYRSYALVNFSAKSSEYKRMFDDLSDIPLLLQKIADREHVDLYNRESLIIFDEVQQCPRAREAIKFFVADGRYDFIETGSLISIHDNVDGIVIPSEEEIVPMYPMDFEEFCWALGDRTTPNVIRRHFEDLTPLDEDLHRTILNTFRKYMLVGGMPQSVLEYSAIQDFSMAENAKLNILGIYRQDIAGRSGAVNKSRTRALFDLIPSELNRHDKVLVASDLGPNARHEDYEDAINWLDDSYICNICWRSTAPDIGLRMNLDRSARKVYMGDTGLLVTMSIDADKESKHEIYSALLTDKLHFNEGMFAENIIAQMLRANGHGLFFYSFYAEGSRNRQEVDFLIRRGRKICPVEVKSGGRSSLHASLDRLMEMHSKSLGQAYVLHAKNLRKEGNVVYLPLYMAMCL